MFKKILVGFDGSPQSMRALETAVILAKLHGSSIKVVEALSYTYPAVEVYLIEDFKERERVIKHREMIRGLAKERGVEMEYVTVRGEPASVIARVAEEEDFDLIVVGNRGLRGFKKLFLESVSSKVLNQSRRAVLVVKEKVPA